MIRDHELAAAVPARGRAGEVPAGCVPWTARIVKGRPGPAHAPGRPRLRRPRVHRVAVHGRRLAAGPADRRAAGEPRHRGQAPGAGTGALVRDAAADPLNWSPSLRRQVDPGASRRGRASRRAARRPGRASPGWSAAGRTTSRPPWSDGAGPRGERSPGTAPSAGVDAPVLPQLVTGATTAIRTRPSRRPWAPAGASYVRGALCSSTTTSISNACTGNAPPRTVEAHIHVGAEDPEANLVERHARSPG